MSTTPDLGYPHDTCPKCGENIHFSSAEMQDGVMIQEWHCGSCDATGHDLYPFANRVIDDPKEDCPHCGRTQTWDGVFCDSDDCPSHHQEN